MQEGDGLGSASDRERSSVWNHGPGWEDALLEAYGIDRDPERTAYYRLLWNLGP